MEKIFVPNHSNGGFMLPDFSLDEVVKCLKALAPNSGSGESGIELAVLIESDDALGPHLTYLFN